MILYSKRDTPLKLIEQGTSISLPGIIQSININGELDSSNDGKSYTITGYKDKKINIDLVLVENNELYVLKNKQSVFHQLKEIEKIFAKQPHNPDIPSKPVIFEIVHPHLNNRGINHVILESFSSTESTSQSTINVSLSFVAIETKDVIDVNTNTTN
ncbi:MAG: hypothetical protein ACRCVW_00105 [Brevinema sp.]